MTNMGRRSAAFYGYSTVIALVITSFIPLSLVLSCAGIFYPYVAPDLGVGVGMMSYYSSFFWIASALFLAPLGKIIKKYNAKVVLSAAVILMSLTFVWLSFARALWQFYLGGFLMGIGLTILLFLAPSTLINRWFTKNAGGMLGIVMAFTGIGGTVWASVGGALILQIGWSATYQVFALLCAVTLLATIFLVHNSPEDKGLVPVGFDKQAANQANAAAPKKGIPAAQAFKMPVFFALFGMIFLLNFGMYVYYVVPSYLSTMQIAVALPMIGAITSSVAMAGQTIAKLVYGFVGERVPHACTIIGLTLGVIGIALLAAGIQVPLVIYTAAVAFGAYYGITNVLCPILTRLNFGDLDYPQIYSRISIGATLGSISTTFICGFIIDATNSFYGVFAIAAVLTLITIALVVVIKKLGTKPEQFVEEAGQAS